MISIDQVNIGSRLGTPAVTGRTYHLPQSYLAKSGILSCALRLHVLWFTRDFWAMTSLLATMLKDPTPRWKTLYGEVGTFSTKEVNPSTKLLHDEGKEQMADTEERAPAWAVLGGPTGGSGKFDTDKVWWMTYFEDEDAYHTDHKNATMKQSRAGFLSKIMGKMLYGDMMKDMQGGYLGPIMHIENPAAGRSQAGFALLTFVTGASLDDAAIIVEMEKKHTQVNVLTSRGKCLRVSIAGPGGDHSGGETSTVVYILEQVSICDPHPIHKFRALYGTHHRPQPNA